MDRSVCASDSRRSTAILLPAVIGAIALSTSVAGAAPAQQVDIGFAKRDSVVLAIPRAMAQTRLTGMLGTNVKRDFELRRAPNGGVVLTDTLQATHADWRTSGFPSLAPLEVRGAKIVTRADKRKAIEVSLRNDAGDIRLFAPADQREVFRQVLARAGAADSVRRVAYDSIGEVFFTGPLARFTKEERGVLLLWADLTAKSTKLRSESFKNITYLVIDLPPAGSVWNDLVVTRAKRLGSMLTDHFPMLKTFATLAVSHEPLGGLKLEEPSCHGAAPYYGDTKCDPVEVYLPLDGLTKFRDADITSQQLLNASIVLVSHDRVEVDLTNQ